MAHELALQYQKLNKGNELQEYDSFHQKKNRISRNNNEFHRVNSRIERYLGEGNAIQDAQIEL
jgi:hypothetical protein